MEEEISNAALSFTCNQDWDTMKPVSGGRFCGGCQKKVYDLTDKNAAYFIKIMHENDNLVCGRFTSDQLVETANKADHRPFWKRLAVAVMVFIGFNVTGKEAKSQGFPLSEIAPKSAKPDTCKRVYLGMSMVLKKSPQLEAIYDYVADKYKVKSSVNGKLIVLFTIGKDGMLKNVAASEHLGKEVRNEVLRVLKHAPKWKISGTENSAPYSLSFTFKDGHIAPYSTSNSK